MPDEPDLVPLPQRRRNDLPRLSVRLSGVEIGQLEAVHVGGCGTTFWSALAVIPGRREFANLELHPDPERQAECVAEFARDPLLFERHLTLIQREYLRELAGEQEAPDS